MAGVCSTCICFCHRNNYREAENCSKNENTAKSTGFWLSVWRKWCVEKELTDEIENYYELAELNTLLEYFYAEVNNKKGEDYEPERLKVTKAPPCPLYVTDNLVRSNRCWRTKQNSFAWRVVVKRWDKGSSRLQRFIQRGPEKAKDRLTVALTEGNGRIVHVERVSDTFHWDNHRELELINTEYRNC